MPLENVLQPEIIELSPEFRLRKYDGNYAAALEGYRDKVVYQNSEGIFDEDKIPDINYVKGMFAYLDKHGEAYFIEALTDSGYRIVGDITMKAQNPPIAIWYEEYRGRGLGTLAMKAMIARLRRLGYKKIYGSTIYEWNTASMKLHQKLGFRIVRKEENEFICELEL